LLIFYIAFLLAIHFRCVVLAKSESSLLVIVDCIKLITTHQENKLSCLFLLRCLYFFYVWIDWPLSLVECYFVIFSMLIWIDCHWNNVLLKLHLTSKDNLNCNFESLFIQRWRFFMFYLLNCYIELCFIFLLYLT
jgi:hypothetical protein